jgi:hypothetical protein
MEFYFKYKLEPATSYLFLIAACVCFSISGCGASEEPTKTESAQHIKEEISDTLLVCEGYASSLVAGMGGKEQPTFVITKVDGKVTKVKDNLFTYTLEKAEINRKEGQPPIYSQLITEQDKIILQIENTGSKNTVETVLLSTGAYKQNLVFSSSEGHCTVAQKAF